MRRFLRTLSVLIVMAAVSQLSALEIGGYAELGNLDFPRDNGETAAVFPGGAHRVGIGLFAVQPLSERVVLEITYASDPILRTVGSTLLSYANHFFAIRVGPFFGILNDSDRIVRPGLSTTVRLFIPEVVTLSLRSDIPIGTRSAGSGDYTQERSELSVGFHVPNAVPTLFVRSSRYTSTAGAGEMAHVLTAYGVETDVFQNGIPYRVVLGFAYQDVARILIAETATTHRYGALVLGTKITAELFDTIELVFDLESSVYTFGREALLGESTDRILFRLRTGVSYRQAPAPAVRRPDQPPGGLIRFGTGLR